MDYEAGKLSWADNIRDRLSGLSGGFERGAPLPLGRKDLRRMVGCADPIGEVLAGLIVEDRGATYDQLAVRELDRQYPGWREVEDCGCGGELEPRGAPFFRNIGGCKEFGGAHLGGQGRLVRRYRCNACGDRRELPVS